MWIFIPRLTLKAGGWNTKITSCWGYFSYFVTRSLKKYLSLLFAEGHGEIVKFLSVVWTCSPSPLFILVPEERLCDGEDVWGSAWLIALFGWGFPYHNWEETPFGFRPKKRHRECFRGTEPTISITRTLFSDSSPDCGVVVHGVITVTEIVVLYCHYCYCVHGDIITAC